MVMSVEQEIAQVKGHRPQVIGNGGGAPRAMQRAAHVRGVSSLSRGLLIGRCEGGAVLLIGRLGGGLEGVGGPEEDLRGAGAGGGPQEAAEEASGVVL